MKKNIQNLLAGKSNLVGLLLIFILPFAGVVYQLIEEINVGINFAKQERLGIQYNFPLRNLLEDVQKHRGMVNGYLNNDASFKDKIPSIQSEIESDIREVDAVDRQLGVKLKTTEKWVALKQKWQTLKGNALRMSPQESFDEHTALIADILSLIFHVGDTSNLILDPVLDSYYLMDAVVTKIPSISENMGQIRGLGTGAIAQKKLTPDEKAKIAILLGWIEAPKKSLRRGLQVSKDKNPVIKQKIEVYAKESFQSTDIFLDLVEKKIINSQTIDIQSSDYFAAGTKAIEEQFRLYDAVSPVLDRLLQERIDGFSRKKYLILAFSLLVLATMIYVLLAFARSQKKRAESDKALRKTEEKYRTIFENAVDGIFQTTSNGHYLSANPALARIYGYESTEELIANLTNIEQQLYVDPNRRLEFKRLIQEYGTVSDFESQVYRKDGRIIWISENAHVVRDAQGELLYYEGSVVDVTERKVWEEALRYQQACAEELLLNILPSPIAQRLKLAESTIADSFAEVTVLFADLVDFTKISAQIPPTQLVDLLNRIFSQFDQLSEKHGLEKIKTIGDAYMVVGGLPTSRPDHAEAIAEMALDMQQAIQNFHWPNGEPLHLRIGINTGGPVVGAVIGMKKFAYDVWGDAVNIASRMESHGKPGCIHVTAATYERLKDKYELESRGAIAVKGKGEMTTYWLLGRKLEASAG